MEQEIAWGLAAKVRRVWDRRSFRGLWGRVSNSKAQGLFPTFWTCFKIWLVLLFSYSDFVGSKETTSTTCRFNGRFIPHPQTLFCAPSWRQGLTRSSACIHLCTRPITPLQPRRVWQVICEHSGEEATFELKVWLWRLRWIFLKHVLYILVLGEPEISNSRRPFGQWSIRASNQLLLQLAAGRTRAGRGTCASGMSESLRWAAPLKGVCVYVCVHWQGKYLFGSILVI